VKNALKKILIIEDEKNIIMTLKMMLTKAGYEVSFASNGLEGLNLAMETEPDLILLDLVLPKMNGYLVCEAIREKWDQKEMPILIMSAKTQNEDIDRAYRAGANTYVTKPFSKDDIMEQIQEYLSKEA